ncbi:PQQ-like beta-propeller repeat protein [Fimbriiglobus ruber]|uniref:Putative serine/threonine protein kinase related protein n=1 Tax=Fimbriiglobus ruber TaxID=1908690 RepID=A0A225DI87_9BACT|nr:PQQ-like beta-propeller repeat protein [Fimbriiglobus ruber]OWK35837.1 putative serine/threonine protein kinase related protein [Fimbriiglobus ruber]
MTSRFLLLALLGFVTSSARAGDWPQFRGPNSDNKVSGFTVPPAWPKELTQKWKTTVGEGLASPALVGDKVYAFARQGGDELTWCLDAANGSEVWKDKYPAEAVKGPAGGFPGPRSSPAVAGGKVCTFGVGGTVSCLDAATGKVAWRKDTKNKPRFFTSSSPVVADGLFIVDIGSDSKGELTAYDVATGDAKWAWTGDGASYGSPVLAKIGGEQQVVLLTAANLVGVKLADGKLLWKAPLKTGRYQTGTPVVDGDTVICAGSAFTIEKKESEFTAKQLWKAQAPHQYCTPVLKDGRLYGYMGMGKSSKLYCQDAKTGKVLWEDTTTHGECGYVLDAGPVLVATSSDSSMVAFKPSDKELTEVAKYKVSTSPVWSDPILAGSRVFVKDKDAVILWTVE